VREAFSLVGLIRGAYPEGMSNDFSSAGARNLADWHDACLHSLGIETRRTRSMWWCDGDAPFIYLTAITLTPEPDEQRRDIERIAQAHERPISVCDCWSHLDLTDLGFEKFESEAWYVREPDGIRPPDEKVERVSDPDALAEFESANTDGFEATELHELGHFGVYGTAVLEDPRIRVFVRRDGGKVTSGSMACISGGVVGVYAVATVPNFRRRGYGEQVTWAAVRSAPSSPAILQPSHEGLSLYRRMGFGPIGSYSKWLRFSGRH
jgi:GNAT superfamily N-acetyltransferase